MSQRFAEPVIKLCTHQHILILQGGASERTMRNVIGLYGTFIYTVLNKKVDADTMATFCGGLAA